MEESPVDRRRHQRAAFTHPIRFKLFTRDLKLPATAGYLKDMSQSGARIGVLDPHGRLGLTSLKGVRAKLEITLPGSDTIYLVSIVKWVKRPQKAREEDFELGIEFEMLDEHQLRTITEFLAMRHTDRTMFWTVWDSFQEARPS